MLRLRCSVIFLDEFLGHLAERALERADEDRITTIEYVGCVEGPSAGKQWARLGWTRSLGLPDECLFDANGVTVCMSPQTQKGLRDKWVDFREGEIVVG